MNVLCALAAVVALALIVVAMTMTARELWADVERADRARRAAVNPPTLLYALDEAHTFPLAVTR